MTPQNSRLPSASHSEIPLANLMLCWTPGVHVMAVLHPDYDDHGLLLDRSDLACSDGWSEMDDFGRVDKLHQVLGQIVVRDNVPIEAVRRALSYCPEAVRMGLAPHPPSKRGNLVLCQFSQIDEDGVIRGPFA
ncbi:hypothetical protein GS397_14905 [Sphingobium yanoikuyae]|uniref:Uncharacterized protein n=1 Tax=Sphingobium yanoikuyae TaxID=13690 RepID=A0A6P1GI43_SPHYA|nr:hypothetical protein [Sphingobium yanoikuyae]QHD68207.1 hypothetical protein GS397_14905 [Sphingobium yanoikuyae]